MSEVRAAAPGASTCTQCGASFTCGRDDPHGCWCAALPALPRTALESGPLATSACLCSACLRALLERTDLHRANTDQPSGRKCFSRQRVSARASARPVERLKQRKRIK